MAIKPILFNAEMVRAILDSRKTQTRRLVKAKGWKINDILKWREEYVPEYWFTVSNDHQATVIDIRPPYYRGDILWVRETWNVNNLREKEPLEFEAGFIYAASEAPPHGFRWVKTSEENYQKYEDGMSWYFSGWRPSIHMPKEAARIFLRVTDIRAERLQDITDADALKEGVPQDDDFPINSVYCPVCHGEGLLGAFHPASLGYMKIDCENCDTPVKRFSHLWNSTIKYDDVPRSGWEANPWVWVIEFERTEQTTPF